MQVFAAAFMPLRARNKSSVRPPSPWSGVAAIIRLHHQRLNAVARRDDRLDAVHHRVAILAVERVAGLAQITAVRANVLGERVLPRPDIGGVLVGLDGAQRVVIGVDHVVDEILVAHEAGGAAREPAVIGLRQLRVAQRRVAVGEIKPARVAEIGAQRVVRRLLARFHDLDNDAGEADQRDGGRGELREIAGPMDVGVDLGRERRQPMAAQHHRRRHQCDHGDEENPRRVHERPLSPARL